MRRQTKLSYPLFCSLLVMLYTTTCFAANDSDLPVLFTLIAQDNSNTRSYCLYQQPQAKPCKKVLVSKQPLFQPHDLRYAELVRKPSLTLSSGYREFSNMMPGKLYEDLKIHLVFKPEAQEKIEKIFKTHTGKLLAVIINNQIYLTAKISALKNQTFTISKNMDVALASQIVHAITLARKKQ